MSNTKINPNPTTVTIADLCEAIYNGKVRATSTEDYYLIKMRDLVQLSRVAQNSRPQPRRELTRPLAMAS